MSKKPVRPSAGERAAQLEAGRLEAQLIGARASIVSLGRALFAASLAAAHREGYIERVIDQDCARPDPAEAEAKPDSIEQLRRLMAYSPDREATAIIEAVSPDLMDAVLGRPADLGSRFTVGVPRNE